MKIIERLRHLKAKAVERMKAINDAAVAAGNRALTPVEQSEYDSFKQQIVDIDADLAQLANTPSADPAAIEGARTEALKSERERVKTIQAIGTRAKLKADFVQKHVTDGTSVEEFRNLAFEELAGRSEENPTTPHHSGKITTDQREKLRLGMEEALMHRWSPAVNKLSAGNEFRGMSLLRMAEETLIATGVPTRGLTAAEIAGLAMGMRVERMAGYMGTTDFPGILANTTGKVLRAAYEAFPQTWKPIARQTSINDFKTVTRHQLSEAPTPLEVKASGEFKTVALSEAKESYALKTYGEIIAINRQTIINDDLGAFTRIPLLQGRAFAQLESDIVWALITSNPTMGADSKALFHTDHGNISGSAGTVAIATLGAGRAAMRMQKNIGAVEYLNLVPRFVLAPPDIETVVDQYLTATQVVFTKGSDVNPFVAGGSTPLAKIIEPRLSANSTTNWYLAADPAQVDIIEYAYLSGQEGVYTEQRMGFEVDGMEIKARLDFGAQVLDWRGLYRNAA